MEASLALPAQVAARTMQGQQDLGVAIARIAVALEVILPSATEPRLLKEKDMALVHFLERQVVIATTVAERLENHANEVSNSKRRGRNEVSGL